MKTKVSVKKIPASYVKELVSMIENNNLEAQKDLDRSPNAQYAQVVVSFTSWLTPKESIMAHFSIDCITLVITNKIRSLYCKVAYGWQHLTIDQIQNQIENAVWKVVKNND